MTSRVGYCFSFLDLAATFFYIIFLDLNIEVNIYNSIKFIYISRFKNERLVMLQSLEEKRRAVKILFLQQ